MRLSFFKQNFSCSCSCGEQYTWNTMQYNCHDLFERHFWTPLLSSEIPTDFMKNSLKWFCVFHSRSVKLWVRSWHYKSWTNFSVLEFMTQVQSAQVINLSKKKGRFCNWQHRPRKQLSEILYLRVQIKGETYVQTNFEFSGLYDEIWPIKLTDHSKFTNWEIHG